MEIATGPRHRFLVFSKTPRIDDDPDAILVELLAQLQIVSFRDHQNENHPHREMESVPIKQITLSSVVHFMLENVMDHHVWNELVHGRIRSYNECVHTSCRIWNHFKDLEHTTYKSDLDIAAEVLSQIGRLTGWISGHYSP